MKVVSVLLVLVSSTLRKEDPKKYCRARGGGGAARPRVRIELPWWNDGGLLWRFL